MNDLSIRYRAHVCNAMGREASLTIESRSLSKPLDPGSVMIRNRAFTVGFPDWLTIRGEYQRKPDVPFVPGSEFCGTIDAIGDGVEHHSVGDSVMGSVLLGAFAERVVAPAEQCFRLPESFDPMQGAAFLTAYKTAYVGLVERGALKRGETVLVHAAAGGVGLAAVDLAKTLGARVIAMASSDEKLKVVREYGADHVLAYDGARFRDDIKTLTDGRGADVIYDPVGGDVFDESTHCIAPFGRLLVIGFAGGRIPQLAVNYALIKQISVIGVRAGEFGRLDPEGGARVNSALLKLASAQQLRPYVSEVLPFESVSMAFAAIEARRVIGRIVVDCEA